jgi:hypothetical protein
MELEVERIGPALPALQGGEGGAGVVWAMVRLARACTDLNAAMRSIWVSVVKDHAIRLSVSPNV